jgi:hypothetical protein
VDAVEKVSVSVVTINSSVVDVESLSSMQDDIRLTSALWFRLSL